MNTAKPDTFELSPALMIQRRTAIIVGLVGIAELIYGISTAPQGQFRLQVSGLIMGALLFYGGFRVVSALRWLAFLGILPCVLVFVSQFALVPCGLQLAQWRLMPGAVTAHYAALLGIAALTIFVAHQLSRPELLDEHRAAGRGMRDMRVPLTLGLVVALGATWFQYRILNGEEAQQARQMAADKFGDRYQYYINAVWIQASSNGTSVSATVQAWNDNEVLQLPVHWTK
ncbi:MULTISPECIES: hypothetical protein [Massilia]|uniref:Uncharacterized protein n=1 Tax=Massilia haematophila TaxID=457923 RepID=A0ABV7PQ81_9BURK|nr:hypothetical protein [Massilia sp.]